MKVINYFNNTKKRDFIDCRITGLRDYFGYYNVNLDSYDVFILGQTIDCSLLTFRLKQDSPLQLCLLGATHLELEHNIFDSIGVSCKKKQFSDDMRGEIKQYIDREEPVIARIDIRYLTNPNRIQKKFDVHCVSTVLVCGYDFEDEDCVYIELKEKNNSKLKKVRFCDFEKAVNSNTFPLEINRLYFEPVLEKKKICDINTNRNTYLWKAMGRLCEIMLDGDRVALDNNYEFKTIESGLGVLKKVIMMNRTLESSLHHPNMNIEVKKRILYMYCETMRDMMTPGSNYCYRIEFGDTLIAMSKKLGENKFYNIGKKFKEIAKIWRELTRVLSKWNACTNNKKIEEYFSYLNRLLEEVYQKECQEFTRIRELVEGIG